MIVSKHLVIFALVIALAYAKKGKGGDGDDEWDHLIHYEDANEGPQDQDTQYVPGQPGIDFFHLLKVVEHSFLHMSFYQVEIGLKKKLPPLESELNKLFILSGAQKRKLERLL